MTRNLCLVAVVAAAGLALGACGSPATPAGGGSGSAPTPAAPAGAGAEPVAWASTACGGASGLLTAYAQVAAVSESSDPAVKKAGFGRFVDSLTGTLNGTVADLTKLGPPKVANGADVQKTALGAIQGATTKLGAIKTGVAALDPKDPGFEQKFEALNSGANDPTADFKNLVALGKSPDMKAAFDAAPACKGGLAALEQLGK